MQITPIIIKFGLILHLPYILLDAVPYLLILLSYHKIYIYILHKIFVLSILHLSYFGFPTASVIEFTFSSFKASDQIGDIHLQFLQGDLGLRDISFLGAGGQAAQQGEVAAVAPHDLDHETAPGSDGGLFDLIHVVDNAVQGCIGADAQVGTRQVVVDRGRQANDWNVEGGKIFTPAEELVGTFITRPTTDD